jgi:signal transduction histidine kinase
MPHPPCRQPFAAQHTLLRLAVLPAALVAAIAIAAVVCVFQLPAACGPDEPEPGGGALWGLLAVAALLTGAVVTGAAVAAAAEAGTRADRVAALCRQAARGRIELQVMLRKLELGERVTPPRRPPLPEPMPLPLPDPVESREAAGDALAQLRHEIAALRWTAEATVAEATALPARRQAASDVQAGLYVGLARRTQGLVHRQIECIEELQNDAEDPELLKGLCHVGHQATRIRRHAENLAILGGGVAHRSWTRPVRVSEVLRACVAESEHYARVRVLPPPEGTLRGHAVADLVHLLVELIQNAAEFSAPQTRVLLSARRVAPGLVVEVEDRGLGMTASERERLNAVLAGDPRAEAQELLDDGHVGLFVVASLARRHGVAVQLQSNVYGGVQAVVVLPRELLAEEAEERRHTPWRSLAAAGAALPGGDPQDLVPRRGGASDER